MMRTFQRVTRFSSNLNRLIAAAAAWNARTSLNNAYRAMLTLDHLVDSMPLLFVVEPVPIDLCLLKLEMPQRIFHHSKYVNTPTHGNWRYGN